MRALRLLTAAVVAAVALSGCAFLQSSAPSLEVGECLNITNLPEEITELPAVNCDEPHEAEVFYVFDLADGTYNQVSIFATIDETCVEQFEPYVGTSYWESELFYDAYYPLEESWNAGDREVMCIVYAADPTTGTPVNTTGSLQGSQR